MKIYFAAHATTTDNEEGIASGWKNVELSELGKKQAKEMREHFKDIKIDLIYCSDLKRAVDTVKIAFGDTIPVKTDKRLRELNYGDFNGQPKEKVEGMKIICIKEPFPNGESYNQALDRTDEFYEELKEKHSDKTVLIVGHRATQYGLESLINHRTIEELISEKFKWQPHWEYNF